MTDATAPALTDEQAAALQRNIDTAKKIADRFIAMDSDRDKHVTSAEQLIYLKSQMDEGNLDPAYKAYCTQATQAINQAFSNVENPSDDQVEALRLALSQQYGAQVKQIEDKTLAALQIPEYTPHELAEKARLKATMERRVTMDGVLEIERTGIWADLRKEETWLGKTAKKLGLSENTIDWFYPGNMAEVRPQMEAEIIAQSDHLRDPSVAPLLEEVPTGIDPVPFGAACAANGMDYNRILDRKKIARG